MNSPWKDVGQSRQSLAKVKETQRRMNLASQVSSLETSMLEVEQWQSDVLESIGYENPIGIDDGTAPLAPENVQVTAVPFRELDVTWDPPPAEDFVDKSVLEVTPDGSFTFTIEGTPFNAFADKLEGGVPHEVRVMFVDRWGRGSDWSDTFIETPMRNVGEQIDLAAAEIAGALGWANLEPLTDPEKMGDDVVTARAMATQNFAGLNAWIENGAIQNALIGSLTVDKIISGQITTAEIEITLSGKLIAGQTVLNASGLGLPPTSLLSQIPSASQTISNTGTKFSSFHFFDERTISGTRGCVVRADGDGTSRGHAAIYGLRDLNGSPFDGPNSAGIDVKGRQHNFGAEAPSVAIWPWLDIQRKGASFAGAGGINTNGDIFVNGGKVYPYGGIESWTGTTPLLAQNATWTMNHNLGSIPAVATSYVFIGSGQYQPLPVYGGALINWITTTQIQVFNGFPGGHQFVYMLIGS